MSEDLHGSSEQCLLVSFSAYMGRKRASHERLMQSKMIKLCLGGVVDMALQRVSFLHFFVRNEVDNISK